MTVESKIRPVSQIETGIVLPKRKTRDHRMSGREKVLAGIAALSVAGAMLAPKQTENDKAFASGNSNNNSNPLAGEIYIAPTKSPDNIEVITVEDVLRDIRDKYGVIIPEVSDEYSQEDYNDNSVLTSNILPTLEEAKIMEEAISYIPSPDRFAPLIICFKNSDMQDNVSNGSALGWQWPAFFHPSKFADFPPNNFPYDRLVDSRAAFELNFPDAKMSDPLPEVNPLDHLPFLQGIVFNENNIKINTDPAKSMPWTTQKERLMQVVVHEPFHNIQDEFSLANVGGDPKTFWDRQYFSLYDMETGDITNPLYVTFAKLNGWKLVPNSEKIKIYDPEYANSHPEVIKTWTDKSYQRDEKIWGANADRDIRVSIYGSYGPIQEATAEYWTAHILYPKLLTDDENTYFDNIQKGLATNPDQFIAEVVGNPDILLKGTSLDKDSSMQN